MPADDPLGLDDDQRCAPTRPATRQPDPEVAVGRGERQTITVPLIDRELLAQGGVLQQEVAALSEGVGEL